MRIGITGATGFVGRHLARRLAQDGHELVLLARGVDERDCDARRLPNARWVPADVADGDQLARAFVGCHAVAHCAGINREIGQQTYRLVHVEGTSRVIEAAEKAGVRKVVLLSFLRARPGCCSPYHESKWEAEELVRNSGLAYTVLKSGMIYGKGDHMLDHLSHALHTFPVFPLVGKDRLVRPLAIADMTHILEAALVRGRLDRQTVAVTGPEAMPFSDVVRRIARVVQKRPVIFPLPEFIHYLLARCFEQFMEVPLIATSQVRMLAEGMETPLPFADQLPDDLLPQIALSEEQIRLGLPAAKPFGLEDFRCRWGSGRESVRKPV